MAFYKILYWQKIPSQVKAWDDFDEVNVELAAQFTALIDQAAQEAELTGTDDYLAQWHWSEETELAGTPQEVAEAVKQKLETEHRP